MYPAPKLYFRCAKFPGIGDETTEQGPTFSRTGTRELSPLLPPCDLP